MKEKAPEGLVSDILDANQMVEARWSDTKGGSIPGGQIQNESCDVIVLAMM